MTNEETINDGVTETPEQPTDVTETVETEMPTEETPLPETNDAPVEAPYEGDNNNAPATE